MTLGAFRFAITKEKIDSAGRASSDGEESSASSPQEKLVRVKAACIFNKPLTKQQRDHLGRLAKKPDSEIDVSDISPLTDEELAEMLPK